MLWLSTNALNRMPADSTKTHARIAWVGTSRSVWDVLDALNVNICLYNDSLINSGVLVTLHTCIVYLPTYLPT